MRLFEQKRDYHPLQILMTVRRLTVWISTRPPKPRMTTNPLRRSPVASRSRPANPLQRHPTNVKPSPNPTLTPRTILQLGWVSESWALLPKTEAKKTRARKRPKRSQRKKARNFFRLATMRSRSGRGLMTTMFVTQALIEGVVSSVPSRYSKLGVDATPDT